jgi:lysozyme
MAYMQLDATGIAFIKANEGLPTNSRGLCIAYQDSVGVWTIGYGHTEGVHQGQTMTVAQANSLLPSDINGKYGKCVNTYIKLPMTQNQFDAMTDFCYNIGVSNDPSHPGFPQSQVCKLFNTGNIKGASNAFLGWLKPITLLSRRQREIKLFNTVSTTAQKNATPSNTNNNTNATLDAQKVATAKIANAKIQAQTNANNLAKAKALASSQALAKAKLTKDPALIAKAQAVVNTQKKNNIIEPNNTKKNILKSGFGFLGLIAMIIVFKYGYDL